ncbi:MAG: LLM class flavin-dependent oxidoreductase [Candidatus Heimdallarchaeaceae archaeon]|jgi:hypothetical protein
MNFGVVLPLDANIHSYGKIASKAENAGWDGVFVWDAISVGPKSNPMKINDPWIVLALIAENTEKVRIGTYVTGLPRRRPWKLAREMITLDHLSNGRLTVTLATGAADDAAFSLVNEEPDVKIRARKLDEGIDVLKGLLSGEQFSYQGEYFQINEMILHPPPIQKPCIPMWIVGVWGRKNSFNRTLKCEGIAPISLKDGKISGITPKELKCMSKFLKEEVKLTKQFDIIVDGETPGDDTKKASSIITPWQEAGATWWMENAYFQPWSNGGLEGLHKRIKLGPPTL